MTCIWIDFILCEISCGSNINPISIQLKAAWPSEIKSDKVHSIRGLISLMHRPGARQYPTPYKYQERRVLVVINGFHDPSRQGGLNHPRACEPYRKIGEGSVRLDYSRVPYRTTQSPSKVVCLRWQSNLNSSEETRMWDDDVCGLIHFGFLCNFYRRYEMVSLGNFR